MSPAAAGDPPKEFSSRPSLQGCPFRASSQDPWSTNRKFCCLEGVDCIAILSLIVSVCIAFELEFHFFGL
eukprot:5680267-Amphidinium_carterae.1